MLRINTIDGERYLTLVLEGSLAGDWVPEAVRAWESVRQAAQQRDVIVNLYAVSYVSPAGRELLAAMCRAGAKLSGTGMLVGALIREINEQEGPIENERAVPDASHD